MACFRRGFVHAPPGRADQPLVGLAHAVWRAAPAPAPVGPPPLPAPLSVNATNDALVLLQMAVQAAPRNAAAHLLLGTVLAARGPSG